MNEKLKGAERALSIALATFSRIETEISTYSAQLEDAGARERTLREQRAPLNDLSDATARRIAAESLLKQAMDDLEPAREALQEAERRSVRERLLVQKLATTHEGEQIEIEFRDAFAALEEKLGPDLDHLLELQERSERCNAAHTELQRQISPPASLAELQERGGAAPPKILAPLNPGYLGMLPDHQLRQVQTQATPLAWSVFHFMLARRLAKRREEAERESFRESAKRLAEGTRPDYR